MSVEPSGSSGSKAALPGPGPGGGGVPGEPSRPMARLAARIGGGQDWGLLFAAALIGVVMAGVAMAFILPIRWLEHEPPHLLASHPTLFTVLVPLMPVAGAILCGLVLSAIPAGAAGYSVPAVMYSIHRQQSRLPLRLAIGKWFASTFTIGSGGSAGPEGPIVVIGASIGSRLGRLLGSTSTTTGTFLGCAAAAGMASVFNAPVAGIFFVLEVLLRDFSLRTFTPIVIAAVVSSATTQAVLGATPLFGVGPDFFAGANEGFTLLEIPNYLVLGILAGVVSAGFIRGMMATEGVFARLPVGRILRPAIGAAMLGILGLAYVLLSAPGSEVPPFYGNGYTSIADLLRPARYVDAETGAFLPIASTTALLLGLVAIKALATWLTLGSGGSGGLFAPALLLGAALGGAVGHVVAAAGWAPSASPAHYALVGMAAMIAATSHAPLTAILIVYELTRSYEVILPLMLAAVIATIVGRLLFPESVYTVKLAKVGLRIGGTSDLPLLRRLVATDVPLLQPIVVHPDESAERLVQLAEQTGVGDFVVLDRSDRYVGMVTGVDLRRALVYREAIPLMQVSELMRSDLPTVAPDETLDIVLEKFNSSDMHCLVVLSADGREHPEGVIARSRVLRRYQSSLEE